MSAESIAMFEEGKRLLGAGDAQKAMETLYAATQKDPSDTRPYGYLGMALVRLGDLPNGIAWLQGATQQQPNDAATHYNLAVALSQAQRFPEAKAALETALTLNPQHTQARAALDKINVNLSAPTTQPFPSSMPSASFPVQTQTEQPGLASGGYASPQSLPSQTPAQEPGLAMGGLPMPAYSAPQPMGAAGMQYNPAANQIAYTAPTSGQRVMRGLGWGALCGQWWTVWNLFWATLHGLGSKGDNFMLTVLVMAIVFGLVFAVAGAIVGLIIGAMDSDTSQGAIIGVVAGVLLCGVEVLLTKNSFMFINIFFWFFTGRYVGANIAAKVQRPVSP